MLYPYTNPVFQPAMRLISAITQANPAVVTTSFAHNYKNGMIVRLDIPSSNGMQQINQQTGVVTVLSSTTFSVNINSTYYDAFVTPTVAVPPPTANDYSAAVVPVGEVNETLTAATVNVLPTGVF